MTPADLRRITAITTPALVPELGFRSLPPGLGLEAFRARHSELLGPAMPYWAVAWPGGQALARCILDNPGLVAGRAVVDLGCGAGLVAAAAMRAGAASAEAVDIDPLALIAAGETAAINGLSIATRRADLAAAALPAGAVIAAGDLWYERLTGRRATAALERLDGPETTVLIGDPDRPGRPRRAYRELARYEIAVPAELAPAETVLARVYLRAAGPILTAHCPHARTGDDAGRDSGETDLKGAPRGSCPGG